MYAKCENYKYFTTSLPTDRVSSVYFYVIIYNNTFIIAYTHVIEVFRALIYTRITAVQMKFY